MSEKTIDFAKDNVYRHLYPSMFESYLCTAFSSDPHIDDLTLDFSNLDFVDVSTLLNICAFVQYYIEDNDNKIKIALPRNKSAYTFFKYWNFKEAFEKAVNNKFSFNNCLVGDNVSFYKNFFADNNREDLTNLEECSQNFFNNSGQNIALEKLFRFQEKPSDKEQNFFGIKSFVLQRDSSIDSNNVLQNEVHRWQHNDIETVISNVIEKTDKGSYVGYVSTRIILESVSNALAHPNGSLFQIASRFSKPHKTPEGKNEFAIVFWDNGISMIQTLSDAHNTLKKNIKANLKTGTIFPKFNLNIKPIDTNEAKKVFIDVDLLKEDFQENYFEKYQSVYGEPFIFLATFFPGISSKADEKKENSGYGLYELFMAVIESFNGKVIARSGNYRLVMKKASSNKPFTYDVDIKERPAIISGKPFKGNLLSIVLPIHERNLI